MITCTGGKFQLLHPEILRAIADLSDTKKTIQKPLLNGKAAGELKLMHSLFPPEGIRRNSVPARFTFDFELNHVADFQLHLMVELISQEGIGDTFVLGLITHDQWKWLSDAMPSQVEKIRAKDLWVGVKYSPINRKGGYVFLSKGMYDLLLQSPMMD